MQKRPPVLLCSAISGTVLGAIIYWVAGPSARLQTEPADFALRKFESAEGAPIDRKSLQEHRRPIANAAHPKLDVPDFEPRVKPEPLATEYPFVKLDPRGPTAIGSNAELPRLTNPNSSSIDEEELPFETRGEIAAEAKEDEPARVARKFLTLEIAKKAKALGKRAVRYVAPWVKTEVSPDKQTAIVFFDSRGKSPDCDVHLRFDPVREKWNVTYVRGGGFGNLVPNVH